MQPSSPSWKIAKATSGFLTVAESVERYDGQSWTHITNDFSQGRIGLTWIARVVFGWRCLKVCYATTPGSSPGQALLHPQSPPGPSSPGTMWWQGLREAKAGIHPVWSRSGS